MSKFDFFPRKFSFTFPTRDSGMHQTNNEKTNSKQIKMGARKRFLSLSLPPVYFWCVMKTEKALAATAIKLHLKQQGEKYTRNRVRHMIEAQHWSIQRWSRQRSALRAFFTPKCNEKVFQLVIKEINVQLKQNNGLVKSWVRHKSCHECFRLREIFPLYCWKNTCRGSTAKKTTIRRCLSNYSLLITLDAILSKSLTWTGKRQFTYQSQIHLHGHRNVKHSRNATRSCEIFSGCKYFRLLLMRRRGKKFFNVDVCWSPYSVNYCYPNNYSTQIPPDVLRHVFRRRFFARSASRSVRRGDGWFKCVAEFKVWFVACVNLHADFRVRIAYLRAHEWKSFIDLSVLPFGFTKLTSNWLLIKNLKLDFLKYKFEANHTNEQSSSATSRETITLHAHSHIVQHSRTPTCQSYVIQFLYFQFFSTMIQYQNEIFSTLWLKGELCWAKTRQVGWKWAEIRVRVEIKMTFSSQIFAFTGIFSFDFASSGNGNFHFSKSESYREAGKFFVWRTEMLPTKGEKNKWKMSNRLPVSSKCLRNLITFH